MFSPVASLVISAALTLTMLLFASFLKSRGWTLQGWRVALGNRDDVPEASAFAGRADRAAKNMLESLVLFASVLVAASLANVPAEALVLPCALFVWSRLAYALLYWAGVKYLRTLVWGMGAAGVAWIGILALPA